MQRTSKAKCKNCFVHLELCYCDQLPTLDLPTQLLLVIHAEEIDRPSNSGKLAVKNLKNAEMRIRGLKDKPLSLEGLADGRKNLLLYPHPDALILNEALAAELAGNARLIVPDGTWGQGTRTARRLLQNIPGLVPVKLPPGPPTTYRLRKETNAEAMSTFEAISRALGCLEGVEIEHKMQKVFDCFVERMLFMRGQGPRPLQSSGK